MIHNTTPFSAPNKTTTPGTAFWHVMAVGLLAITPVAMTTWGPAYTGLEMLRDTPCLAQATLGGTNDCLTGKILTIRR